MKKKVQEKAGTNERFGNLHDRHSKRDGQKLKAARTGGGEKMNARDHAILGALIAGGTYSLYKLSKQQSIDPGEALLSVIGGAIAGVAPDILEPATNPNHRSLFHSGATLALLNHGNRKVLHSAQFTESQKAILLSLSTAYASHLVADGTTTKGVPLLI